MKHSIVWQNTLSHIARSIDAHRFDTWFRPLIVNDSGDPRILSLSAPNQYIAELLEKHYKKNILSTAKMFFPDIEDLSFGGSLQGNISSPSFSPVRLNPNFS